MRGLTVVAVNIGGEGDGDDGRVVEFGGRVWSARCDPVWREMTTVWHNTHLTPAVRIAQDRRITGGLIYDGKLRDTRTEVVYLTQKYWPDGNIYGSFCFEVEWAEIAKNRALY